MSGLPLATVEERLGYRFSDPALLELALTHSSAGEVHNQRLEFLGDAVVGMAVAKHLYERFPNRPEGDLTRIRAAVVSAAALDKALLGLEVVKAIRLGPSLARRQLPTSLTANIFEAVIGAIYLDGGFEPAASVVVRCLAPEVAAVDRGQDRNWKSILQQITQRDDGAMPTYTVAGRHGPPHRPWFEVEAQLGEAPLGRGVGTSKKAAAQAAAKAAVDRLLGDRRDLVQEGAIPPLAAPLAELLGTRPLEAATDGDGREMTLPITEASPGETPMGEVEAAEANRSTYEVVTQDALRLQVEHIPAQGAARGAIWLGHAILANRRSLDRPRGSGLGSVLAAAGLEVYLADLRGHGGSRRIAPETASTWGYHDVIRFDLPALTSFVRARHPGLPVAGLGHSLAGHAGLAWLGLPEHRDARRPPLDAFVCIGGNIWLRQLEPSLVRWGKKLALSALFSGFVRTLGKVPAKRLGYGSEDVSGRFWRETEAFIASGTWRAPDGTDYLAGLARIALPVLAVVGSGDRLVCHETAWRRFHRRIPRCELARFGPEQTGGFAPGHMEIVTDARSRKAWEAIAAWLARALASR